MGGMWSAGCGLRRLVLAHSLTANAQAGYCRLPREVREPTPTPISIKLMCIRTQHSTMASAETQLFERPLSAPCLQHPLVSYAGSTCHPRPTGPH